MFPVLLCERTLSRTPPTSSSAACPCGAAAPHTCPRTAAPRPSRPWAPPAQTNLRLTVRLMHQMVNPPRLIHAQVTHARRGRQDKARSGKQGKRLMLGSRRTGRRTAVQAVKVQAPALHSCADALYLLRRQRQQVRVPARGARRVPPCPAISPADPGPRSHAH